MQYKKILIAVDSSAHSMNAATKGFELAHALQATVGIVSVIDVTREVVPELALPSEKNHPALMKNAETVIQQLTTMYDRVEDVLRFSPVGYPKKEIILVAKEWNADLIVMGTHGRTGLSYLLMGSVAEYVIKHANIPVMIVPLK